ncbi:MULTISPECIES: hypothetical protein [unclassified Microcoleus]|uniref:hypothetical protein n=1 Tax=unclassified Microcoleus TaxID=2642155 RepID=UPI001D762AB8|nr:MULTISPECIES: hypothetical protein [unclassified Microcoleus]MCC3445651.1 hypothetical protein [Microcoleus sp. PH2017_03_ELD_O_A]MCC3506542.1 hypothetical protein [Microcoleus sp. PH2017_19_SFW_U_A]MCC3526100.1 hypothetical protein [Microcoleus sp. PH2017_20_SFW_D_A]MCC3557021.1 hypothetical protein [Microcoleus sp. PH2017_35_SFW_U_B]
MIAALQYKYKQTKERDIMGRAITSGQLELRVARAKRREAAILAKKLAVSAKPYAKKPPTDIILANQVGNEKVFVRIPTPSAVLAKLPDGIKQALGMKPASSTLAQLGTGSSIVDFAGNHKKVLRVSVYPGLPTPQVKTTTWGTRVVKMTDKSFSFPVGGDSVDAVVAAFQAAFTGTGPARVLLGASDTAGYAVLRLGKTTISTVKA